MIMMIKISADHNHQSYLRSLSLAFNLKSEIVNLKSLLSH
jgi:hypothetical protein